VERFEEIAAAFRADGCGWIRLDLTA